MMNILLVERSGKDTTAIRNDLIRQAPLARIDVATSLKEARALLSGAGIFDLVLADLTLPDGSALILLEAVRGQSHAPGVIFLADPDEAETAGLAFREGAAGFLVRQQGALSGLPAMLLRPNPPESELSHQILFECNPHPMWIYDIETLYHLDVNPAAVRKYGYTRDEFLAMTIADMHPPEEVSRLHENVAAVTNGLDEAGVWRHRLKDGRIIDVEIISHVIQFKGRRSELVLALDITQRRKAEEALRETEERYRNNLETLVQERTSELAAANDVLQRLKIAIEHSMDGVVVTDLEGYITFFNAAWASMHGYSPIELTGKPLSAFFSGEISGSGRVSAIESAFKNGAHEGEVNQTTRSGTIFPTWMSVALVKDRNGEPSGYIVVARDITAEKQAKELLWEAKERAESTSRAKSAFLANMSHEIRTPMNGVIGMTELLLDTPLTPEQYDYAKTVRVSAEALLSVINDILDYSKIESGKLEFECINFDLRCLLGDIVDMLAVTAHKKGLEFACLTYQNVPALLQGDPGRLRQILNNMVNNAIKFTAKGEVIIRVTVENEDAHRATIRFDITDTGTGIPRDRMDRLFKSFSQVDPSTTRKFGGTGLGLAISKQLANMMGGQIGVESREGKGSSFWFTARLNKQPRNQADALPTPQGIKGDHILIVDDSAINRQILREILISWGCRSGEAASGGEALTALHTAYEKKDPYRMALLDMQMPGMDGETLGKLIKATPAIQNTLLIMVTSLGERGDAARVKAIGFAAYLTKPVKQSQLYDCLTTVTGIPASTNGKNHPGIVTKHSIADNKQQGLKILLAEDNLINQKVAMNILQKSGYLADIAVNGREAIEALKTVPYDLVLMDVQMPEMDGFEASRVIRDPESGVIDPRIPIIAMTAHAMKGDRERCLEAGMDDYIAKPIRPKELLEKITCWIGNKMAV